LQSIQKNIHWFLLLIHVLASLFMTGLLYYFSHLPWELALKDSFLSVLILLLTLWCCMLAIKAYPTKVGIVGYSLFIALAGGTISSYMDVWILKKVLAVDNTTYAVWLVKSQPIRYIIAYLICGWSSKATALKGRIQALENQFQLQADAAILLREAELFKLRQQLQPHFLYNSLNSISALIMIQPDKAQEMIGKLSEFLRNSVKKETQDRTSIEEELQYIETYLCIETVRFGDRLSVQVHKQYNKENTIPPFLLQPIIENAIKFGLYGKTGKVVINMNISEKDQLLVISVTNPYDPHMNIPKGTGFGLEGIRRRLYLLYARTDLLETNSDDTTFTTILKIPQTYV
jgi:two-component system, LytTR family, sensor kinase